MAQSFVGVDITQDIVNLKARLAKVRVGDSGQLHVLALDGPQRGQFVLHPSLNGKNALALRDQPRPAGLRADAGRPPGGSSV